MQVIRLVAFFLSFTVIGNIQSQIMVEEPAKELGDIFESRGRVTTYFTLVNPYQRDTIHILNIETSCGCTAILTQDTLILPGQSLELEVSYDPTGRLGLFMKSIALETRTGRSSFSTLYLKISGNVVSETSLVKPENTQLLDYKVAPVYYFPITPYDTSYLDFSYFITFVNDLTYEIDYYQFTTVGFEVAVRNKKQLEEVEYLLNFSRAKIIREFKRRGFYSNTIFFQEPVFVIDEIPVWAAARIKAYSVNFNSDFTEESVIEISGDEFVEKMDMALDVQKFNLPDVDELVAATNFEMLEGKLFQNSKLELRGLVLAPKKADHVQITALMENLSKGIYKELKKRTGISKAELSFDFDSLGVHPEGKFRILVWDKDDEQDQQKLQFVVKDDAISAPLLPTYRQSMLTRTTLDTTSDEFRYFWQNLIMNYKLGHAIELVIETSVSKIPRNGSDDNLVLARKRAQEIADDLQQLFKRQTGGELKYILIPVVHGPEYNAALKKLADFAQYEYVNIIPTTHANGAIEDLNPQPYQVNFDYYFNGVDTASWLFDKFAGYLAAAIEQDGYVELRIESSISRVPVEHDLPNDYLVYSRAHESEKRLRLYLRKKLIDDNRVIFTEQRYLIQGPEYDGSIPILQFRKFQYVRIVPEKYLTQE